MNDLSTTELLKKLDQGIYLAYYEGETYYVNLLQAAYDRLKALEQELIDERYRHDRLQDFCVAQGEELSKLKAQQRWIPVAEGLPEFAEDVFIVDAVGVVEKGMYIGDDTWLLEGGTLSTPYVRWWKPFPEPPKEV